MIAHLQDRERNWKMDCEKQTEKTGRVWKDISFIKIDKKPECSEAERQQL